MGWLFLSFFFFFSSSPSFFFGENSISQENALDGRFFIFYFTSLFWWLFLNGFVIMFKNLSIFQNDWHFFTDGVYACIITKTADKWISDQSVCYQNDNFWETKIKIVFLSLLRISFLEMKKIFLQPFNLIEAFKTNR